MNPLFQNKKSHIYIRTNIKKRGTDMNHKTKGTCSMEISFDVVEDTVHNVHFVGGCNGNTQGVSKLVEGMKVDDVIDRLEGIKCGPRPTSCPDQLAKALKQYKEQKLA